MVTNYRFINSCYIFLANTLIAISLSGCAGVIPSPQLEVGVSNTADVLKYMGKPSMSWHDANGKITQSAYSNQPAGYVTFMVYFNKQGVLTSIDQVMNEQSFSQVSNGMNQHQVHKILGPERFVDHFSNLQQVDWDYGYCSESGDRLVYSVTFDEHTMLVNGSEITPDTLFNETADTLGDCVPYRKGETYFR